MNKEELEQYQKQVSENEDTAIKLLQDNVLLKYEVETLRKMIDEPRYKLNDADIKNVQRVSEMTSTDYKVDENGDILVEELTCIIDDLLYNIDNLQEEIDNMKEDIKENYQLRYRNEYEYYGINPKDFY